MTQQPLWTVVVQLLGAATALAGSPASLTCKSDTAADADLESLVGRDPTP